MSECQHEWKYGEDVCVKCGKKGGLEPVDEVRVAMVPVTGELSDIKSIDLGDPLLTAQNLERQRQREQERQEAIKGFGRPVASNSKRTILQMGRTTPNKGNFISAVKELCARIEDARQLINEGRYDFERAFEMAESQAARVMQLLDAATNLQPTQKEKGPAE